MISDWWQLNKFSNQIIKPRRDHGVFTNQIRANSYPDKCNRLPILGFDNELVPEYP